MSSISATQTRHAFFNLPELDDEVLLAVHGDSSTFASKACHADSIEAPVDRFTQAHEVVTDNKDDSGRYASECDAITRGSHTRPFADDVVLYNGHAGLGGNAASRCEPIKTPSRIDYPNLIVAPADARVTPREWPPLRPLSG